MERINKTAVYGLKPTLGFVGAGFSDKKKGYMSLPRRKRKTFPNIYPESNLSRYKSGQEKTHFEKYMPLPRRRGLNPSSHIPRICSTELDYKGQTNS